MPVFDLNQPDEILSITAAPKTGLEVDPAAEFRARLDAVSPELFFVFILIGLNVAVYLAMVVSGVDPAQPKIDSLIRWGADFGPRTITQGEWWRLFTSMFLHIGFLHLAFNMFVLWQAGPFVERLLGNIGFLMVYLVSGLAGGLASLAWHPFVVSAGASGAIFGVYGALLGFLLPRSDSVPSVVLLPIARSAVIFIGYNVVYGFIHEGTDIAAHLGGLAAGFVCGLAMSLPLTVESLPRRRMRQFAVAAAAGAVCLGAAYRLPHPVDIMGELRTFATVEAKALAVYQTVMSQARQKTLGDAQIADRIEKEVIPPWAAEHSRLAALKGLPERQQKLMSLVLQYMKARQQGWETMAAGCRQHDAALVSKGHAKQMEAQSYLMQMRTLPR
jgi:membrane associated rhomboid family serine protease